MDMIQLVQDLVVYMEYGRFVQSIQFFFVLEYVYVFVVMRNPTTCD